MDKKIWWWRVYDEERGDAVVDDSNSYNNVKFLGGETARTKAESVARKYITNVTRPIAATCVINDVFIISHRGLVLSGDLIDFTAFGYIYQRKIAGVEFSKPNAGNKRTGLLIKCRNNFEITELRKWNFSNQQVVIFKQDSTETGP